VTGSSSPQQRVPIFELGGSFRSTPPVHCPRQCSTSFGQSRCPASSNFAERTSLILGPLSVRPPSRRHAHHAVALLCIRRGILFCGTSNQLGSADCGVILIAIFHETHDHITRGQHPNVTSTSGADRPAGSALFGLRYSLGSLKFRINTMSRKKTHQVYTVYPVPRDVTLGVW